MNIRDVQMLLASTNYYSGAIDGDAGPLTMRGVGIVQRNGGERFRHWAGWPEARRLIAAGQAILGAQGLPVGPIDGWAGPLTNDALTAWHTKRLTGRDWIVDRIPGPDHDPAEAQRRYPQQAAATMRAFYGHEGGPEATAGLVRLPFPFRLAWKLDQQIATFRCHRRLEQPMTAIFDETARHYGQTEFERLRLHIWGGCFNHRTMRGGTALSTHAWGAAVDLDPERNQLPWGPTAPPSPIPTTTPSGPSSKPTAPSAWAAPPTATGCISSSPDSEEIPMQTDLPPLPFWQARSWWLTLIAVIAPVLALLGLDWPWVTDPETLDAIMHVVGGASAALAWRERVNPRRRLVVG